MSRYFIALSTACLIFLGAGCGSTSQTTAMVPAGPVAVTTAEAGVIPALTNLVIRTNEQINTDKVTTQPYSGSVARDVVDQSGRILVPQGSTVELAVLRNERAGAVTGKSELELGVRSITIDGKTYQVQSGTVSKQGTSGIGANQRTAVMTGGGAALGTVIGAIAGGGSGAAIGAAVGAGGGALTQILTRGRSVKVPAETLLTFRLQEPIRLVGYTR